MNFDVAIVNGHVVSADKTVAANSGIREGRIAALSSAPDAFSAREVIDASGMLIFPGLVDAHAHFREPGAVHKEGFKTGTMAAAAGGVTSVFIMPTDDPLTVSVDDYAHKMRLAEGQIYVDVALLAGLGSDLTQIAPLAGLGVLAMEIFFAGLSPELRITDNARLLGALALIAQNGMVAGITPGDDDIVNAKTAEVRSTGDKSPLAFARSRPSAAEVFGVARACVAAAESGAAVHLRQISCRGSVDLLRLYRPKLSRLSAEVLPHNLFMTEDDLARHGPYAKMSPPLRARSDVESVWSGLIEGAIDIVASDHAPHLRKEKEPGHDDIWRAPLGIPGIQTMLPLLLNEAARGRITCEQVVRFASEQPARIFGIYPRKGALLPGSDADLVIVDPGKKTVIRNEDQYTKAGVTPFDGCSVIGSPSLTMVRGRTVMRSGKIVGDACGSLLTHRTHG